MESPQEPIYNFRPDMERFAENTADQTANRLVDAVIVKLQQWRDKNMLLSGDSGLQNVWEEICVQVQAEYSIFWESVHLPMLNNLLEEAFEELPTVLKEILSYVKAFEEVQQDGTIAINTPDVVEELRNLLLAKADDFTNSRIEHYLQHDWDMDDDEEEEEGDEENEEPGTEEDTAAN